MTCFSFQRRDSSWRWSVERLCCFVSKACCACTKEHSPSEANSDDVNSGCSHCASTSARFCRIADYRRLSQDFLYISNVLVLSLAKVCIRCFRGAVSGSPKLDFPSSPLGAFEQCPRCEVGPGAASSGGVELACPQGASSRDSLSSGPGAPTTRKRITTITVQSSS